MTLARHNETCLATCRHCLHASKHCLDTLMIAFESAFERKKIIYISHYGCNVINLKCNNTYEVYHYALLTVL